MDEFEESLKVACWTYERQTSLRVAEDAVELIVFLANGYVDLDPEVLTVLELPSIHFRSRRVPGEVPIPKPERAQIIADRLTLLPSLLMVASGVANFRVLEFRDKFHRVDSPDGSRARVRWGEYLRANHHQIPNLRRKHIIDFTRTWHTALFGDICPPFKKPAHGGG